MDGWSSNYSHLSLPPLDQLLVTQLLCMHYLLSHLYEQEKLAGCICSYSGGDQSDAFYRNEFVIIRIAANEN